MKRYAVVFLMGSISGVVLSDFVENLLGERSEVMDSGLEGADLQAIEALESPVEILNRKGVVFGDADRLSEDLFSSGSSSSSDETLADSEERFEVQSIGDPIMDPEDPETHTVFIKVEALGDPFLDPEDLQSEMSEVATRSIGDPYLDPESLVESDGNSFGSTRNIGDGLLSPEGA